ncbi:hypothetical protein [Nocardioides stalactiti]|uniref:hypothetical protein n=1 Tax=Nocardioides stalactiti TaxID=2755356 RepID=UPI001604167A|nr:hypothetical protein [Nocardioides stalactiti]
MADETIAESGWQHVIEHVALDRFPRSGALDVNGQVTMLDTAFDFHGTPDAVAAHLTALAGWLAAPDFGRLDHEVGVLRAEADVRGSSPLGRAFGWRYGARGPGLVTYAEPGLGRATAEALSDRVGRVFTSPNAVLILDGPPPADLRLELRDGTWSAMSPAVPVEKPRGTYEEAGIVLSGTVPRSGDMFVGVEVLQRVLVERLRHEEGGAYAPWTDYERVDADTAVITAGSDIQPPLLGTVVSTTLDLLDELARSGPREDWLVDTIEKIVRQMEDPYAAIGAAAGAAMRHLHGREAQTLDEMVAQVRAVTAESLAEGFGQLRDTLLLGAPAAADAGAHLRPMVFPRSAPGASKGGFRSINWPADVSRLRVLDHAFQITGSQATLEATYDDIVGLLVYADGVRTAVRGDGYTLTIDPLVWADGDRAVAELDRRIPVDRHLPHPATTPSDPPPRHGFVRRWWPALRRGMTSPTAAALGFVLTCLIVAVVVVSMVATGHLPSAVGPILVFIGVMAWQSFREERDG